MLSIENIRSQLISELLKSTRVQSTFEPKSDAMPPNSLKYAQSESLIAPHNSDYNQLSPQSKSFLTTIEHLFSQPTLQKKLFHPIMKLIQNAPESLEVFTKSIHSLEKQRATPELLTRFTNFATKLADKFIPSHNHQASLKQVQFHQIMQQVSHFIDAQNSISPTEKLSVEQSVQLLKLIAKETPQSIDRELFALPIIQKAGISTELYQQIAHHIEPIRFALLIIEAQKTPQSSTVIAQIMSQIQLAFDNKQPLDSIIHFWEQQLMPITPKEFTPANAMDIHYPSKEIIHLPQNNSHGILLQAISPTEGVLPDSSWQPMMDSKEIALLGSMLIGSELPQGFHHIKYRLNTRKKENTFINLLLYVLNDDEYEAYSELEKKPSQKTPSNSPYHSDSTSFHQVGQGEISINVDSPYILLAPYSKKDIISAPLNLTFRFLYRFVDPDYKYSRSEFLTFKRSAISQKFNKSIQLLNEKGIQSYSDYSDSVDNLFVELSHLFPLGQINFKQAQKFFKDEVLLYLAGKRSNSIITQREKTILNSNHGDIMASICQRAAGLMAIANEHSQSLIHFADSISFAKTKPYYMQTLQKYLTMLSASDSTTNTYQNDQSMLSLLPPNTREQSQVYRQTPQASEFISHYRMRNIE